MEEVISLSEVFSALKKRWKMILIVSLVCTLGAGIMSIFLITPKYEASTKLFIGKEAGDKEGYNQSDVMMYQQLMKTYTESIKTRDLVDKSLKSINSNLNPQEILRTLEVTNVANTQILQISYKCEDPKFAMDIVEAVTNEFVEKSKELVSNGNIRILEKVQFPEKPVSPNKKLNIIIGFLLGLMIGVALTFLLEFLDNTFKNKEQIEKNLDLPVIGVIPLFRN